MKVVRNALVLLFSCLYLWVGSTVLWHTHETDQHHDCHGHHTHDDQNLPDEDACPICFFIHTGAAVLCGSPIHFSLFEKPFVTVKNDRINIQYKHQFIQLQSNKDPPFSA